MKMIEKTLRAGTNLRETYNEPLLSQRWFSNAAFGVDVEQYNKMNALHVAADTAQVWNENRIKCMKLLLNHGIDINSRESQSKWTALHRHMYNWFPSQKTTQFLIDQGIDVNATGQSDQTATHILIKRHWTQPKLSILKLLHENGANIHAKDALGKTPLQLLAQRPDPNVKAVQYLIHSADTQAEREALKQDFIAQYTKENLGKYNARQLEVQKKPFFDRLSYKIATFTEINVPKNIKWLEKSLSIEGFPPKEQPKFIRKFQPVISTSSASSSKNEGSTNKRKPQKSKSEQNILQRAWRSLRNSLRKLFTTLSRWFKFK